VVRRRQLAPDLSLPQLQARWTMDTTGISGKTGRRTQTRAHIGGKSLTEQERQRLWQQATDAVADGTAHVRRATDASVGGEDDQRTRAAQAAAAAASEMLSGSAGSPKDGAAGRSATRPRPSTAPPAPRTAAPSRRR
jgi:hypothetical protein